MNKNEIMRAVAQAVNDVRSKCPLVPSITNSVTINFVANAQLAVGGSAAMVYLADEGEAMARAGQAMYLNMGTMIPLYADSMPQTVQVLARTRTPWVLDPVGIGVGALRTEILEKFKTMPPKVVRGNASEIIALANLWRLSTGVEKDGVRGVDATDSVEAAKRAAKELAKFIGGAVAVSGECDLITDGNLTAISEGGSELFTKVTGAGCSLGGVCAVYAAVAKPFIAALTAVQAYNLAGSRAEKLANAPGSFEKKFIDELYLASAEDIASNPFTLLEDA